MIKILNITEKIEFNKILNEIEDNLKLPHRYKLITITDLDELVEFKLSEVQIDVILSEINILGSSLEETFELINELFPTLPLLIIDNNISKKIALEIGVQDIITSQLDSAVALDRVIRSSIYRHNFQMKAIIKNLAKNKINDRLQIRSKERIQAIKQDQTKRLQDSGHELRTAMNLIIGGVELIRLESNGAKTQTILKMIRKSCDHILELAEISIDSNYESSNSFTIKKLKTDLKNIILPACQEKNLNFEFTTDIDINSILPFNFLHIKQILLNLIYNSIKFTTKGGIKIHLEKNNEKKSFKFLVKDSGRGIQNADIQNIFKRNFRCNNSQDIVGSGIGLSLVTELVTGLNGDISATSDMGKGTEITIEFPFNPVFNINNEGNASVLIIEDDESMTKVYDLYLKKLGIDFHCVQSLKDAKILLNKNSYDTIFSDLNIGEDGPEQTFNFLQSELIQNSNIFVVSGVDQKEYSTYFESGALSFIRKPITIENLKTAISTMKLVG